MSEVLTFANPGAPLPTVPGCVSGVVFRGHRLITTQCSVCHKTATGAPIFAVNHINFTPDGERGRPLPYRRCLDCQAGELHPAEAVAS